MNTTGQVLAAELHLEKLVQGVTDAATQLSRGSFGAFFYNVLNRAGTAAHAVHTVRRGDDIAKAPRYGHNPPYHGMPKGHLPARSDLDVPVISRSDDFLFVGNDNAGHNLAGLYSLVATCEANGVNPRAYLADVLLRVQSPGHPAGKAAARRLGAPLHRGFLVSRVAGRGQQVR